MSQENQDTLQIIQEEVKELVQPELVRQEAVTEEIKQEDHTLQLESDKSNQQSPVAQKLDPKEQKKRNNKSKRETLLPKSLIDQRKEQQRKTSKKQNSKKELENIQNVVNYQITTMQEAIREVMKEIKKSCDMIRQNQRVPQQDQLQIPTPQYSVHPLQRILPFSMPQSAQPVQRQNNSEPRIGGLLQGVIRY